MRRREVIALIASSAVVSLLLALVTLQPPSTHGKGAGQRPQSVAAGQVAAPDRAWDDLFQSYGDTSGNWSGADGAQSLAMPDGSTIWFFGDTYLGVTGADGTRYPPATWLTHNSALRYAAGRLSPILAAPPSAARSIQPDAYALVKPPPRYPASRYELFNGDQVIDGGKVVKFYQLADHGLHPDYFPYKLVGTQVETFAVGSGSYLLRPSGGTLLGVQDTVDSDPLIWGVAVAAQGGYLYIYGVRPYHPDGEPYPLYLARVRAGGLAAGAPWQYYTAAPSCTPGAGAWSADPARAAPLRAGASAGFSVTDVNGTWVLLTGDTSTRATTSDAVAYYAHCPSGFAADSPRHVIYRQQLAVGFLAYEYRIVPQFSSGRDVLVSYSVDSVRVDNSCLSENNYDASIYRPHFLDVALPGIAGQAGTITVPPDTPPARYRTPQVPPSAEIFHPGSAADTYASVSCHPGTAPAAPSAIVARGQAGGLRITWTMHPAGMWQYTLVACDLSTDRCRRLSLWGVTSTTLQHLIPGHTYEVRVAAAKWVPRPVLAWSRPLTATVP